VCPVVKRPFTKLRREVEPRWVAEYCSKFYPNDEVRYRCPLGAPPRHLVEEMGLEKALRAFRPYRPEVDALVITKNAIILIEAKVHRYVDGIGKLLVYEALVPDTPELAPYLDRPVKKRLLLPILPEWIVPLAKRLNVELVTWAPDWVLEYWAERDKYWTPEAVAERERRKQILKALGFY